jgi:hypothetical protein
MLFQSALCQFVIDQAPPSIKMLDNATCRAHCPCHAGLRCLDEDDHGATDRHIWQNSFYDEETTKAAYGILNVINAAYELELELELNKGVTRQ